MLNKYQTFKQPLIKALFFIFYFRIAPLMQNANKVQNINKTGILSSIRIYSMLIRRLKIPLIQLGLTTHTLN